jgi:Pentapeptide repeats (8 copies)
VSSTIPSNFNQNHHSSHNLQQPAPDASQSNPQSKAASEMPDQIMEIKAATIGAKATLRAGNATLLAAALGALVTASTGYGLFEITKHHQGIDGRQKALNDYVNGMKELIASTAINREQPKKIAALQYAKTLLVMRELEDDGDRKGQAIRFLYENCLVPKDEDSKCQVFPSILAQGFNLKGANLNEIDLQDTWMPYVTLQKVVMRGANLQSADLSGANLREADITPHQKSGFWSDVRSFGGLLKQNAQQNANLRNTKLLYADLSKADLSEADLSNADLRYAKLTDAVNLTQATLTGACYVAGTEEQYLPPNFDPKAKGMVALSQEVSDPSQPDTFKPCSTLR